MSLPSWRVVNIYWSEILAISLKFETNNVFSQWYSVLTFLHLVFLCMFLIKERLTGLITEILGWEGLPFATSIWLGYELNFELVLPVDFLLGLVFSFYGGTNNSRLVWVPSSPN